MKELFTASVLFAASLAMPSVSAAQSQADDGSQLKVAVNVVQGDADRVSVMDSYYNTLPIQDGFITVDPAAQPLTFSATKKDGVKYVFTSFEVNAPAEATYNIAYGEYDIQGLTQGSVVTLGVQELQSQEIYVKANVSGVPAGKTLSDLVVITDCDRNSLIVNAGGYIATDVTALPIKIGLGTNPDTGQKYSEDFLLDVTLTGEGMVEYTSPSVYSPKGWYCAGLTDDSELNISLTPVEHVMLTVPVNISGVDDLPADALEFRNSSYAKLELTDGKITVDQAKLPVQISMVYDYKKQYSIKEVTAAGTEAGAEFDEYYNAWKVYGLTDGSSIDVEVEPVLIDWIHAPLKVFGADASIVSFMDSEYEGVKVDDEGWLMIDPATLPLSAGVLYQYSDTYDVARVEVSPSQDGDVTYETDEDYPDWGVWYINRVDEGATVTVWLRRFDEEPMTLPVNVVADEGCQAGWLIVRDNMDNPVALADGAISVAESQCPLTFALDQAMLPDPNYTLVVAVGQADGAQVEKGQGSDQESSVWYRVSGITSETVFNVNICKANGTGMGNVDADGEDADIYNLQGIRVHRSGCPDDRLPAGVYIKKGCKFVIK